MAADCFSASKGVALKNGEQAEVKTEQSAWLFSLFCPFEPGQDTVVIDLNETKTKPAPH